MTGPQRMCVNSNKKFNGEIGDVNHPFPKKAFSLDSLTSLHIALDEIIPNIFGNSMVLNLNYL